MWYVRILQILTYVTSCRHIFQSGSLAIVSRGIAALYQHLHGALEQCCWEFRLDQQLIPLDSGIFARNKIGFIERAPIARGQTRSSIGITSG